MQIEIDKSKAVLTEEVVHELLKCLGRVAEPEGHFDVLKQPKRHNDGRLRNVRLRYRHLVVALNQVNGAEEGAAMQAASKVLYVW